MLGAVAHEITHYHRWRDTTEINDTRLEAIDEALTSLEAILRFPRQLNEHDVRQLVSDAIQRLQIFAQNFWAADRLVIKEKRMPFSRRSASGSSGAGMYSDYFFRALAFAARRAFLFG